MHLSPVCHAAFQILPVFWLGWFLVHLFVWYSVVAQEDHFKIVFFSVVEFQTAF